MPTILDQQRTLGRLSQDLLDEVVFSGFNGVLGCECGGPAPGTGCAGKGVDLALKLLDAYEVYDRHDVEMVIYDVLGDVVCGGFSLPMRRGYAQEIYIVACGELLTMNNVNMILRAVAKLHKAGANVGVAGIIDNMRGVPREKEIMEEFGKLVGVPVICHVPRSKTVQRAESQGKTVIEAFTDSPQANVYRQLAETILETTEVHIPTPTTIADLKDLVHTQQAIASELMKNS
jgi:nitrogenase iron protein NifH